MATHHCISHTLNGGLFVVVLFVTALAQSPGKIPVGGMFGLGEQEQEAMSAFNFQVNLGHGQENPAVRLLSKAQEVRMEDSFSVISTMCRLLNDGVFALFGTHSVATHDVISSYVSKLHMPYVTSSMAVPGDVDGYRVYMRPYYTNALLDLIRHHGWTKVHYVYNNDDGLQRVQQLFNELARVGYALEVELRRVTDIRHAFTTIKMLDESTGGDGECKVLLDMTTAESQEMFSMRETSATFVKTHFLLVNLNIEELCLAVYEYGGLNITGLRMVSLKHYNVTDFASRFTVMERTAYNKKTETAIVSYQSLLSADAITVFRTALSGMLKQQRDIFRRTFRNGRVYNNGTEGIDCDAEPLIPWKHGQDMMKQIRKMRINGLTGRIQFDDSGMRKGFKLDVLAVSLNKGLAEIGHWSMARGLEIKPPEIEREPDMEANANVTYVVTSILTAPYLVEREPPPGKVYVGNDRYKGYCADLAKKIAHEIKIDYEIRSVKDESYGSRDENGTWNGMVGELIRGEADMAIAPLTITSSRERVIDFSKPFMSLGISIMIKKTTKEAPGVFSFMYPLSFEIWMCVIFAYIGVSVVLFLVSRFSPFEWHIEDNTDGPTVTNNFTIFNSLWFSLAAFMQQGCDIEPRSTSGRIVGSVWWFFTLIIISSYTANLAAFLTMERMQSPIESAEDLAKQTEIRYGTISSGSTKSFFKKSTIPVYERMWAFMQSAEPSVFVQSNEAGVDRVRKNNGRYAFLLESTTNDYMNQLKPCDTMKVGSNLDSKGYGVATPLGSPLRDHITLAVLGLREKGELQKLEKKWWYEKGQCGNTDGTAKAETTNSLKLSNVAGIFYILVGGLSLALLMAVVEFLYKSRMEAQRRQMSFSNAVRSKARLSIHGQPDKPVPAGTSDLTGLQPVSMSMYTYAPAAQLISLDGYAEAAANTHTQV